MASPFSIFRRNQKVGMAIVTLIAIVAFVFLGNQGMRGSRDATTGPAVVSTKYGNLIPEQVRTLRYQRRILLGFLENLARQLSATHERADNVLGVMRNIGSETDEAVIEKWLYARQAEKIGIVVDDKAVNEFITLVTNGGRVNAEVIHSILGNSREPMSEPQLFAILREELLALRLKQLCHQLEITNMPNWVSGAASPGERWDYFKRRHEEATIEVATIAVKDFVGKVKDPSDDELKKFFDEHNRQYPRPDSPEPGFHIPRKVRMEYLKANQETYDKAVTEAEITARYEKKKEQYGKDKERYEKEVADETKAVISKSSTAEKVDVKKPEEKKIEEKKLEEKKTDVEKKPEEKKPEEKKVEVKKPDVDTKPAETKPAAEPKKDIPPKISGSSNGRPSPFRFVAFAEEKKPEEKNAEEKKIAEKKIDEKKPEEKKPEEKKADDKKPTDKKPTDEKPATPPSDGTKPAEKVAEKVEKPESGTKDVDKKTVDAKKLKAEKKKKTAEERLRDQIREELGRERLEADIAAIRESLAAYRKEFSSYDAEHTNNSGAKKPTPPEFGALAEKYHMTAAKTGLVSFLELSETDIGKSYGLTPRPGQYFPPQAMVLAFESRTLYQPQESRDGIRQDQYVWWKTSDEADRIPKFDDDGIKAEVLKTWKMIEARKLAREAAIQWKQVADKAQKPLKEAMAVQSGVKVIEPPPFTWLTLGILPNEMNVSIRMSDVEGLEKVSDDFMRQAFNLSSGKTEVSSNRAQTDFYVIRLVKLTPYEVLWSMFKENEASDRYATVSQDVQFEVAKAWREEIYTSAGFKRELPKAGSKAAAASQQGPVDDEE